MSNHYLKEELEELFRKDSSMFAFLQRGSLDGIWYWDLENPDQEWMSPEFWRLFGVDPSTKKHLVSEWQDLIFPEDLSVAIDNFEKHCADPNHPYDQVVRYRHADGGTVWVRCRGIAIRDDEGKPIRLLGAHNDYTSLMRTEQDLAESNRRLRSVLDTATNGIVGLDSQGQVIDINPSARHMLGGISQPTPFPWPSAIKFLDSENLHPLDQSADPINRTLAGQSLRGETNLMTRAADEAHRYVRVASNVIEDDESPTRAVVVLDDISDQELNRQQVERSSRLDALGQLTGGIAHDFNNLLATILYSLELSLRDDLSPKTTNYLNVALNSVKRGSSLTSRLLAFAKRQPGIARSRTMADVFEEFGELVSPTIEATIKLSFETEDPDLWVFCDQAQLENALLNLVLNGRDAIMRAGKGDKITVAARGVSEIDSDVTLRRETEHSYVAKGMQVEHADDFARSDDRAFRYIDISVSDNGPGMTDEVKRRAIDPFFTTKETNSGTGLGLSMVYGFIQQADGELRIYSEEGHGTTIRLLIPRGTPAGAREAPMDRTPVASGQGECVLVVEDEANLLTMIEDILETLGYETLKARSGRDALALIENGVKFDALLTDIVMPGGVGGFELARQARKHRPDLPIVYMSGYTGFTESEMGDVVAPLVQKPCPPAELAEALKSALSGT